MGKGRSDIEYFNSIGRLQPIAAAGNLWAYVQADRQPRASRGPCHTFGRRLRAAGVPEETRKVLLGHTNGDITTHYSAPEITELIQAANLVCSAGRQIPTLMVLRARTS